MRKIVLGLWVVTLALGVYNLKQEADIEKLSKQLDKIEQKPIEKKTKN